MSDESQTQMLSGRLREKRNMRDSYRNRLLRVRMPKQEVRGEPPRQQCRAGPGGCDLT